jgi:hypothetical protein
MFLRRRLHDPLFPKYLDQIFPAIILEERVPSPGIEDMLVRNVLRHEGAIRKGRWP